MTETKKLNLYVLSDSIGETSFKLAQAVMAQFPNVETTYNRYPFIRNEKQINEVVQRAHDEGGLVIHTLATKGLAALVHQACVIAHVPDFDLMTPVIQEVTKQTGEMPTYEAGAIHHLNEKYFDRISAMEFAVLYDDGKDPKGFLEADVVLLGPSRTSKTPLSLFLAGRNLKVANLPLVPQAHIPEELWKVDRKKIIGLTNDVEVLNNIRRERMIAYGLNPDTTYSNVDEIRNELKFAHDLYEKLGCMVINVAQRSIEETATLILEHLGLDDYRPNAMK
ncbi:pyruvate, water dikinase regulatory protein [Schleiferilactobacillus perolens]|jgi:regulator of PEP synthase PpsR (kinase-PPPase family)|uniref:Putative pyruvate, phosphate dikinase regulatory protein n=1 Tax=Schleiferilactobacillus perolens DSM 12744 TaxID=1423792 RepID=A0A0R1MY96_9LACO|nr:pyruvate, water dikinase regulatory protein [Schleiferilactobacillus perolens]KRL13103.1 phosphotransferase yqfL [Schleiferilactobacillus perolens DSM 12744]MCI1891717.1 kinase/pyrophosphorylase [Schleiferilactobacillus harbinensis]MCI1912063.1 kinase/pyrophosphorylase [Schleiferilactobacillus harbinensis]MCI2171783.1 kinase/pyrophosphorylase [Schleiferilactobacillus perolens]